MSRFTHNLTLCIAVAAIAGLASEAKAGFVSVASESSFRFADEPPAIRETASGSNESSEPRSPALSLFEQLIEAQLQAGNIPANGGMSSASPATGSSSAPAALLPSDLQLSQGSVYPFCPHEAPFTPQQMVSEILRPPCA